MATKALYVPYAGVSPQPVTINGHRVLILGGEEELFSGELSRFHAERVERFEFDDQKEQERFLQSIAESAGAALVITPPGIELTELLEGLTSQLPWLH